jgi:hypothetical protein
VAAAASSEEEEIEIVTAQTELPLNGGEAVTPRAPVNPPAAPPSAKPARGVDLAEIDRYLEGLNKL